MIYGIYIEHKSQLFGEVLYFIEDSRHIHQKHGEYLIKILHIPEEHEQSRQNITHTDIEDYKAQYREYHHKQVYTERHLAENHEYKIYDQRQEEIECCR